MTQQSSIFSVLYDLNACLAEHDIDPSSIGIVMPRPGFETLRDAVTNENPVENWNRGFAFTYAGLWFLDGEAYVYAKAKH
jgi:hypothetical protein